MILRTFKNLKKCLKKVSKISSEVEFKRKWKKLKNPLVKKKLKLKSYRA
jgi:hypothetical protein